MCRPALTRPSAFHFPLVVFAAKLIMKSHHRGPIGLAAKHHLGFGCVAADLDLQYFHHQLVTRQTRAAGDVFLDGPLNRGVGTAARLASTTCQNVAYDHNRQRVQIRFHGFSTSPAANSLSGLHRSSKLQELAGGTAPPPGAGDLHRATRIDRNPAKPYNRSSIQQLPSGERSSVGRALDCGSSGRGFEPLRSPHLLVLILPEMLEESCNGLASSPIVHFSQWRIGGM